MIGRQKELDALIELSDILMAGLGRISVIYGDAGIGKSRLIQEWKQNLSTKKQNMDMIWAEGKSLPDGENISYNLLRNLVKSILNIPENTSDTEQLNQLAKLIKKINTADNEFVSSSLAHLLQLPLEVKIEQEFLQLKPKELEQKYLLALQMFMQSLAIQKPLILIFENLQWADAPSIELLKPLLLIANTSPVLISLVSRPERESHGWQLISTAESQMHAILCKLSLGNLSPTGTRELICELLEVEQPPNGLVELLVQKSEGNPLFIEEIMRTLITLNEIERKNGHWVIQRSFTDFEIPDTLQRLLFSGIDRLSIDTKNVLNIASVIGIEFQEKVLEDVLKSQHPQIQLNLQLSLLETNGLIKLEQIRPEISYKFQQSLLMEVIYKTNMPDDVKLLHKSVAEALIRLYPETQDSLSRQLAYHFLKAQDRQKACLYYSKAAQNALDNHANLEAEQFFRKALTIVDQDKDKPELLSGLGQALAQQIQHSEAIKVWQKAVQIYQIQRNFSRLARLYAWMARSAWWNNEGDKNLSFCLEGLKATENTPESSDLALLIHETGRAYYFNNEMEKAQEYCEKALIIANKLHAFDVQAEALATMGILPTLSPQQAISALKASIRISEENNLNNSASRAYINLAAIVENLGQLRMARDYRIKALEFGRKSGGISDEFYINLSIINAEIWLGKFSEARKRITDVKYLSQQESDQFGAGISLGLIEGQLERQLGNFSKANEILSDLIKNEKITSHPDLVQQGNFLLADIMLESVLINDGSPSQNRLEIASNIIKEGLDQSKSFQPNFYSLSHLSLITSLQGDFEEGKVIFDSIGKDVTYHPEMTFKAINSLTDARLSAIKRDYKIAIQKYEKCLPLFKKMEATWWLAHITLEMALVYINRNEPEDNEFAQSLLREALATFKELDCDFYPNVIIEKLRIVKQQSRDQAVSNRENKRELDQAGIVQTSFIPANLPRQKGWDFEAVIEPARETSGDFFDFIELPEGNIGVIIADVGDKGAGAALYMAMCRTLFRTFASEFPDDPDKVLNAVNKRIIADTQNGIFLTVVYGILDTQKGTFTYANAGHNPPCLVRTRPEPKIVQLNKTGKLVGIFGDSKWKKRTVQMEQNDVLVLYTDGVTEAQNEADEFYGIINFCKIMKLGLNLSAKEMISQMTKDVHDFIGKSPILDDITLMVIKKFQD